MSGTPGGLKRSSPPAWAWGGRPPGPSTPGRAGGQPPLAGVGAEGRRGPRAGGGGGGGGFGGRAGGPPWRGRGGRRPRPSSCRRGGGGPGEGRIPPPPPGGKPRASLPAPR